MNPLKNFLKAPPSRNTDPDVRVGAEAGAGAVCGTRLHVYGAIAGAQFGDAYAECVRIVHTQRRAERRVQRQSDHGGSKSEWEKVK